MSPIEGNDGVEEGEHLSAADTGMACSSLQLPHTGSGIKGSLGPLIHM